MINTSFASFCRHSLILLVVLLCVIKDALLPELLQHANLAVRAPVSPNAHPTPRVLLRTNLS
jgi:hypothetical protein